MKLRILAIIGLFFLVAASAKTADVVMAAAAAAAAATAVPTHSLGATQRFTSIVVGWTSGISHVCWVVPWSHVKRFFDRKTIDV